MENNNNFKFIEVTLYIFAQFLIVSFVQIFCVGLVVLTDGSCDKTFNRRIEYIFPMANIACYLFEDTEKVEINKKLKQSFDDLAQSIEKGKIE